MIYIRRVTFSRKFRLFSADLHRFAFFGGKIDRIQDLHDLADLRIQMEYDGFWDDHEKAQKITQRCNTLERKVENFERLQSLLEDTIELIELSLEEGDDSSNDEIARDAEEFMAKLEEEKLKSLLTGEYDNSNAIVTLHAGAGGTEAQDWSQMLYRMYNKYADTHGFKVDLLDWLDGDEAGIKSASFMVIGENAHYEDIDLNVCKTKHLTNTRSSSADEALRLTPPVRFSLEEALDFLETDELLEVTPKALRIRKKILDSKQRKKAAVAEANRRKNQ